VSFEIAITLRRGDFARDIAFVTDAPRVALVGASGCGKTSTLLAIAGLLQPLTGRIIAGGRVLFDSSAGIDLPPRERRFGVLFQDGRLFPHLTVAGNLAYAGRASPKDVNDMGDALGITPLLGRWPRHLSGGEARRVALGRALLARPDALLLDEPLAHLDAPRAAGLLALIDRVAGDLPLLYVTHDRDEAETLGATIVPI
jgi:molybdate transport system ATP-binding protein